MPELNLGTARAGVLALVALFAFVGGARAQAPFGDYVVESAQSDDIRQVIKDGTADLNFIKRIVARKRLRRFSPETQTLSIRAVGDSIEIVSDESMSVRTKPDGRGFDWRGIHGETLSATMLLEGAVLTTTFRATDGEGVNQYRLRQDGLLEVRARLSSPRLPHSIEYTRIYRRTAP